MKLIEARCLALELMRQHGIGNWAFSFDGAKKIFGRCWYRKRAISLSTYLTYLNDASTVRDVILHEIAHALSFLNDKTTGHGHVWKMWCVRIGARPERCYDSCAVVAPKAAYHLVHVDTGEVFCKYHRRPKFAGTNLDGLFIKTKKAQTIGKLKLVRA